MRIYITSIEICEQFEDVLKKLSKSNPENSYFSPLHNFSYMNDIDTEVCLDWLNESEKLIVVGCVNERMREEIALARLCNMEVEYLELE
jgi:hypothetical protein